MSKTRILIIDDEHDFCKIVKINLELLADCEVNMATNGKRGVKLAKGIRPDLILLDINMPRMNGFEVLEKLKKDNDTMGIPVVILSAKRDDIYKSKAFELYDELYIEKPIGFPELKAKIEEVLKRKAR